MEQVTDTITVTSADDTLANERRECMGLASIRLTLGAVMLLADCNSPYIYGGTATNADIERAKALLDARSMDNAEFNAALQQAIDTAFNIYNIIEADNNERPTRRSDIKFASPEWLTDIIAGASQACPAITLHDFLWEVPLALTLHLQLATARRNGTITSRDDGIKEAIAEMKKRRGNDNGRS